MEAGIAHDAWTLEEVALLLEAKNMEAKSTKRGPYKKEQKPAWNGAIISTWLTLFAAEIRIRCSAGPSLFFHSLPYSSISYFSMVIQGLLGILKC
jgi:hypothetical protein